MDDLIFTEDDYADDFDLLDYPVDNYLSLMFEAHKFKIPDNEGKIYIDQHKKDFIYVYVFSDEGPIPHIHIYDKDTGGYRDLYNRGMCLSLVNNTCFNHGKHQDVIGKKQFESLVYQLRYNKIKSPCAKRDGNYRVFSWWKYFASGWNMLNTNYRIKPGTKIPAYDFDELTYFGNNINSKEMEEILADE